MSETAALAPKGAKPVEPYNLGRVIGRVIEKHHEPAGRKRGSRGNDYDQKQDHFRVTLLQEANKITFAVDRNVYDAVGGGDVLQVDYELGTRVHDGSFIDCYVRLVAIKQLAKGDGKLTGQTRKSIAFSAAPGYVSNAMLILIAIVGFLLGGVTLARASDGSEFVVRNTQTAVDGAHITISGDGGGFFYGSSFVNDGQFLVAMSGSGSDWSVYVSDESAGGVTLFAREASGVPVSDPNFGGWLEYKAEPAPFGAAENYVIPFVVPEPVSGASVLGCGWMLLTRRRC